MRIENAFILALVVLFLFVSGCFAGKSEDEPTKNSSQEGLRMLNEQAVRKGQEGSPENLRFPAFRDIRPESSALESLDSVIRPVLAKQFGAAKIIEQNNEPVTDRTGETVLNSMKYVVRDTITASNSREFHAALTEAGFKPSIRLGRKPTVATSWAAMSFLKKVEKTYYSITIRLDFKEQTIKANSYKIGTSREI